MREKLITHLEKNECFFKNKIKFRNFYFYLAFCILIFIIPKNIIEILPFLENFMNLFKEIPLFYNLMNDSKYPDYIIFYLCLMTTITIIVMPYFIYISFYYRFYMCGMFDIYPIKDMHQLGMKNKSNLLNLSIIMIIEPALLGGIFWLFYFYGDFLNDHLRHNVSISNLFTTRFGAFFMMLIWQGFLTAGLAAYPSRFIDYMLSYIFKKKE